MTQLKEEQSLLQKLLQGKSEAEQKRVWEIVAKTGIQEDDPLFLVMVAMGSIEAAVLEVPKVLGLQEEQLLVAVEELTEKVRELEDYTKGLAATSRNLDRKLKAKLPLASRNSGLLAKELLSVALVGLLAGTLFGREVVGLTVSEFCARFPEVCEIQEGE